MKTKSVYSKLFALNLAILFISTSGVLGRYIDLPVPVIILMRALIASILLFVYCKFKGFDLNLRREDRKIILLGGILLGVHWITYFYSLKLSNVAIAMLSLYTFPAITAILEPILTKGKLLGIHLLLGAMILIGIYLLVPDFKLENNHFVAVCLGLISALCYAVRNITIRSKVKHYNQSVLMLSQLVVITIVLSPVFYLFNSSSMVANLPATLLLAVLTTAIGHTLFVYSLKHFSTTSASLMSSLQPVYGIILGFVFLREYPGLSTILGGSIIVSTVLIENTRIKRLDKIKNNEHNQ